MRNCCSCDESLPDKYYISRCGEGPFCKDCWEIWRLRLKGEISFEKMERKFKYRARKVKNMLKAEMPDVAVTA